MTKYELIEFLESFSDDTRIITINSDRNFPFWKDASIKYKIISDTKFTKTAEQAKKLNLESGEGIVVIE